MEKVSLKGRSRSNGRDKCGKLIILPAKPLDASLASCLISYFEPKLSLYLFCKPQSNIVRVLCDLFRISNHVFSCLQVFFADRE